jgi:hypothetical protein
MPVHTHQPASQNDATDNHHQTIQLAVLPELTDKAKLYPGCCLALSRSLIEHIHSLLPPPSALSLSIGSGFGLLEAHLLALPQSPLLLGVEVEPTPNQYLPATNHSVVHGSRFLEPLAAEATTWLFVYPRRVGLVREYLDDYGQGMLRHIIWIGPQADWEDYSGCFTGWDVQIQSADEVGGRAWDMIVVATIP